MNVWHLVYQSLISAFAVPVALVFALHPRGKIRNRERLGAWSPVVGRVAWFHASSVGEVNSILPIVRGYRKMFPEHRLLLTALSPEGLARGEAEFDEVRLLPFDSYLLLRKVLNKLDIAVFVFAETELWPELLQSLKRRGVPTVMVNAVISDYTVKWYRRLKPLLAPALSSLQVLASDRPSAERMVLIGAESSRVLVNGNAKYDNPLAVVAEGDALVTKLWPSRGEGSTLVVGSIWPEECAEVVPAIATLLANNHSLRVIVAVRHLDKAQLVVNSFTEHKVDVLKWTDWDGEVSTQSRVLLVNVMGKLQACYHEATVALVCGSFAPKIGGHNPLEPAAERVPVIMGAYHDKQQSVMGELVERGGGIVAAGSIELVSAVEELLADKQAREKMGIVARSVWEMNQGASERALNLIANLVKQ